MTLFDLITIGILLVSALVGFTRGAVRELVTVFAFTLAALAAVFLLPMSAPIVRGVMGPPWAATMAAVVIVFVIAYIGLRLAGHLVTSRLHQSALGGVDRLIGLAFGVVRALVFLGVFYLVFNLATPPELMPRWIAEAKLLPVARSSARTIQAIAPEGLKVAGGLRPALERAVSDAAEDESGNDVGPAPDGAGRLDAAAGASGAQTGDGYDNRSRDRIDELVERSR